MSCGRFLISRTFPPTQKLVLEIQEFSEFGNDAGLLLPGLLPARPVLAVGTQRASGGLAL